MAGNEDERKPLSPEEKRAVDGMLELAQQEHYYALLGVAPGASSGHIRRAYYNLTRHWHPDRFYRRELGDYKEKIERLFASLTTAYELLTDPARREQYDREHAELLSGPLPQAVTVPFTESEAGVEERAVPLHELRMPGRFSRARRAETERQEKKPRPRRRRHRPIPGLDKIKRRIAANLAKARLYYSEAQKAAEEGRWTDAAAKAYLAMRHHPENPLYKQAYEDYAPKGRKQLAESEIQAAENAESYHNVKAAIYHYERACRANPPMGLPYYRLARLKLAEEDDEREVLHLLRQAVQKEPDNIKYRLALAEHYVSLGLPANARREYQAVLKREPGNAEAREGLKKVRA